MPARRRAPRRADGARRRDAGRAGDVLGRAEAVRQLAARRPLVVVFDDIHWAEPTFLDLLEYLADSLDGVPAVLVCLARPELLEVRGDWMTSKANASLDHAPAAERCRDGRPDQEPARRRGAGGRGSRADRRRRGRKPAVRGGDAADADRRRSAQRRRRDLDRERRSVEPHHSAHDQRAPHRAAGSARRGGARGDRARVRDRPRLLVGCRRGDVAGRAAASGRQPAPVAREEGADPPGSLGSAGRGCLSVHPHPRRGRGLQRHSEERPSASSTSGSPRGSRPRGAIAPERSKRSSATTWSRPTGRSRSSVCRTSASSRSPAGRQRALASAGRRAFARGDMPAAVNVLSRAVSLGPRDDPRSTRAPARARLCAARDRRPRAHPRGDRRDARSGDGVRRSSTSGACPDSRSVGAVPGRARGLGGRGAARGKAGHGDLRGAQRRAWAGERVGPCLACST